MWNCGPKRSCRECDCLALHKDGSGTCYPNSPDCGAEYELTAEEINTPEACDFWREKKNDNELC